MSDLGWFGLFAAIFVLMAAMSGWMVWFSRRAMRAHKSKVEDMVREMRELIDDESQRSSGEERSPGEEEASRRRRK